MEYQVLLFYKYVTITDPENLKSWLIDRANHYHLLGRVIIASEGINGTLEGTIEETNLFSEELLQIAELRTMQIKSSGSSGTAFPRLKVRVRDEIVGTKFGPEIDPRVETAEYISAEELHTWYRDNKDFVVVDMRNDSEYTSGHFRQSINPGLEASRDLTQTIASLSPLKDKTVVTVCTGGVRCEKMSAYLMNQGFKDVKQLDNGMHGYMEKYPGEDFLGTLYTFDNRLTMHFGGTREIIGTCRLCKSQTERYVNCANLMCHLHFLACQQCSESHGTFCSDTCRVIMLPTILPFV